MGRLLSCCMRLSSLPFPRLLLLLLPLQLLLIQLMLGHLNDVCSKFKKDAKCWGADPFISL